MGNKEVYEMLTDRVIKDCQEKKKLPWQKPWVGGGEEMFPRNYARDYHYSGTNWLLLYILSPAPDCAYITMQEASELRAKHLKAQGETITKKPSKKGKGFYFVDGNNKLIKGVKPEESKKWLPVLYYNHYKRKEEAVINGKKVIKEERVPFAKYYRVYHVSQCFDLGYKNPIEIIGKLKFCPIQKAEAIIADMPNKPTIKHEQTRAYYSPMTDYINLPPKNLFNGEPEYYSTAFHELGHSTGHQTRLNRESIVEAAGLHTYSYEELVAEFTALMLCCQAGIENHTYNNSLAYMQSWLKRLKDNPTWLVKAASQAQAATDYIMNVKREYKND